MREKEFEKYLLDDDAIVSKLKAVKLRLSKARLIERTLDVDPDELVTDNRMMYDMLLKIKQSGNDRNGSVSNALRKYYEFYNGNKFPLLEDYEQKEGLI